MAKTRIIKENENTYTIDVTSSDYNYKYATNENTKVHFEIVQSEGNYSDRYQIKDGKNLKTLFKIWV